MDWYIKRGICTLVLPSYLLLSGMPQNAVL